MDTAILEFTLIDDMLFEEFYTSKEYLEFCSNLDELGELSAYDEGMTYDDTKTSLKSDVFKIGRNTLDTTKDVFKVYKYATDSKAKTYKGLWDLFMRLLQLITKVIAFIWRMLGNIPIRLVRLIDWITHLPSRIFNKIKGNIELYITVDDLKNIYSVDLFENINIILKDAKVMMNGDFWTKWKNSIHLSKKDINIHTDVKIPGMDKNIEINKNIGIPLLEKDPGTSKAIKEMIKIYESKLSKIRFVKSIVDLGRDDNVNLYFKTKEISINNRAGMIRTGSYLELLKALLQDMKDKESELKSVSTAVAENLQAASTEDGFLALSASNRTAVYKATQCLSGTINILGNVVKYVNKDIQTFNNAYKRIDERKEQIDTDNSTSSDTTNVANSNEDQQNQTTDKEMPKHTIPKIDPKLDDVDDAFKKMKNKKEDIGNRIKDRHNQAAKEIEAALNNIYK